MKQYLFYTVVFFLFQINFFYAIGQQRCGQCPEDLTYVDDTAVRGYSTNYTDYIRTTPERKLSHSLSVDFSRQSVIDFYTRNFGTPTNTYNGFNVHFVSYNATLLPGADVDSQIGLLLAPTHLNCSSDSSATLVYNNSFNQGPGDFVLTPFSNIATGRQLYKYGTYYYEFHRRNDLNRYTNFVHFTKTFLDFIYNDLLSHTQYVGVRFEIGTYNQLGKACGQIDANQLTVFVSPVRSDGSSNYESFNFSINAQGFTKSEKDKILAALNHGELCPNNCN